MNGRSLFLFGILLACLFCVADAHRRREFGRHHHPRASVHWSYDPNSEAGPSHWGQLDPSFALCGNGGRQSPIDIVNAAIEERQLGDLDIHYGEHVSGTLLNDGHTVQYKNLILYGGVQLDSLSHLSGGPLYSDRYNALQFHFHAPSEHKYNGKRYPLELHIVNINNLTNDLAVVGILFEEGPASPFLAQFFDVLPEDEEAPPRNLSLNLNLALPSDQSYWYYRGSLTTPSCDEKVDWFVLNKVMTATKAQIEHYTEIYSLDARPTQSLNGRTIYHNVAGQHHEEGPSTQINFVFAGMIPAN